MSGCDVPVVGAVDLSMLERVESSMEVGIDVLLLIEKTLPSDLKLRNKYMLCSSCPMFFVLSGGWRMARAANKSRISRVVFSELELGSFNMIN